MPASKFIQKLKAGLGFVFTAQGLKTILGLVFTVLAAFYLFAIPSGLISAERRFGAVEIILLATLLIFCSPIPDRLMDVNVGKEGFTARFQKLEKRQDKQASDIRILQVLLRGIVSEFELEKLRGLGKTEPFMVYYHPDMYTEIKHLDALRFVTPRPGCGVNSIHNHESDRNNAFDLKTYFVLTDRGREYLEILDTSEGAGGERAV